ncbi:uncharacterized protein [Physcomitrium patens]|uniref:Uncharacterized protein n=1 Tax=Physcomitrium patens TaxID=3218 RepID=A0A2K1L7T4_PHYPA|nr:uncharacterized protein LOC112281219 isoform X1 [Physcomitrium patens]PNR62108.1 hypothetical protein PHYPA_000532 [Physcomitrium patens]|eukprot:XP_024373260.1 uncharacterized protein LOC112281219 isoform X1 [Physcomitrella patens]
MVSYNSTASLQRYIVQRWRLLSCLETSFLFLLHFSLSRLLFFPCWPGLTLWIILRKLRSASGIQNRESLRHLKNGMGEEVVIAATVVDTTMVGTTTGPAMETDHVMEMVRATEMEQAMEMTQVLVMETDLAMGMDLEDIIEEEEEEVAAEEAGEEGVAEVEVEVEAVAVAVAAGEGEEEEVTIEPVNSITNECSGVDKIDQ